MSDRSSPVAADTGSRQVDALSDHNWQPHPTSRRYIVLEGHKDALVRVEPMDKGFLWSYGKKSGYATSVVEAKEWVETFAEAKDDPVMSSMLPR